jgi:hypothetical protein
MRVPRDSMGAWAVTDTGKIGDSGIETIGKSRTDLQEALKHFRVIGMRTKNKMGQLAGTEQEEQGMSLLGLRIEMICSRHLEIGRVMVTNLLIEVEGGEKRTARTSQVTAGEKEVMKKETEDGREIGAKSVILNGWMSQQTKRNRHILRRIFRNGKRE